eukprot:3239801-Amphidinium_carterae.1
MSACRCYVLFSLALAHVVAFVDMLPLLLGTRIRPAGALAPHCMQTKSWQPTRRDARGALCQPPTSRRNIWNGRPSKDQQAHASESQGRAPSKQGRPQITAGTHAVTHAPTVDMYTCC